KWKRPLITRSGYRPPPGKIAGDCQHPLPERGASQLRCLPLSPEQDMRRREFFGMLGGVVAWPLVARAQQSTMRVIGFLDSRSPEEMTAYLTAFHRGLAGIGYNVLMEHRWADVIADSPPELASEFSAPNANADLTHIDATA